MANVAAATLAVAPVVVAASAATLRKNHGTAILPKLWAKWVLASCGAKVAVAGLERFDHAKNYVLASNHVSLLDAPAIVAHTPQKVRFVAKRSLFYIPLFGQAAWMAGNIPVDRARHGSAQRKLSEAARRVQNEVSLLFFPEGTRSPGGNLLPFKKGAAVMALQAQVPILPIAVAGTFDILPKKSLAIEPGVIGLAYGEPIDVAGLGLPDRDAVTKRVRDAVAALLPEAEAARQAAR
jgi:1-acyl-sn-glycerol-3-phosphate acyltransferase